MATTVMVNPSLYSTGLPVVTGGTLAFDGLYSVRTFTAGGTLGVIGGGLDVDYLVGGGGGGGGGNYGAGGGGGEVLTGSTSLTTPVTVTIGAVGTGSITATGSNGGDSVLEGVATATGGGGGGGNGLVGNDGGNGGGGAGLTGYAGGTGDQYNGGAGAAFGGGGGGGAGAVGGAAPGGDVYVGGNGGDGVEWPASSGDYYGGGGAGWEGTGGLGGGQDGGAITPEDLIPVTPNTCGGGAAATGGTDLNDGASGVVIVRYLTADAYEFTPIDITGSLLWLDASDSSTITETTGNLDTWTSKSPGSEVWIAGGTGPVTGNTVNGLDALTFTAHEVKAPATWGVSPNPQEFTLFVVAYHDGANANNMFDSAPATTQVFRAYSSNWELWDTNPGVSSTTTATATQLWTIKADNSRFLSVSKSGATPTTDTGTATDISWLAPVIGSVNGSNYFQGKVCEVIMYDSILGAEDTADVEEYLTAKWAV